MAIEITDSEFASKVIEASKVKPVLIDFHAVWCGPCRQVSPILDEIANEYGDKLSLVKLDTDANPKTSMAYGIQSIPTIMLFVDGQPVKTVVGAKPKMALKADFAKWIN